MVWSASRHISAVADATGWKFGSSGGVGMSIPGDVGDVRDGNNEGGLRVFRGAVRGNGVVVS